MEKVCCKVCKWWHSIGCPSLAHFFLRQCGSTSFISPWESSNGLSINTAEQSRVLSHADLYSRCSSISFALSDAHSWSKKQTSETGLLSVPSWSTSDRNDMRLPHIHDKFMPLLSLRERGVGISAGPAPVTELEGHPGVLLPISRGVQPVPSHRDQKNREWSCCGTRMCSGLSSTNAGTQHSQRMCVHVLALLSQSGKWTDVVAIFSFRNKMFPGFVCLKSQGFLSSEFGSLSYWWEEDVFQGSKENLLIELSFNIASVFLHFDCTTFSLRFCQFFVILRIFLTFQNTLSDN